MHITTLFRSAKKEPPSTSGYYLAFRGEDKLEPMWYSAKYDTWTHNNIEIDHALTDCFNCKVIAWAPMTCAIRALSVHKWD